MKQISVVVPVYNEEENVPIFVSRIEKVFATIPKFDYEIIFSMDPSSDATEAVISKINQQNPRIKLIKFARRFGQPMATFAGIDYASGDAVVVIDVDLQDPPEVIPRLIKKWEDDAYDVVYAKRSSRKGETLLKRFVSFVGYYIIGKITTLKIPRDTGDFRLLDRRVVREIVRFKEQNPFLRGLTAYVGFKQGEVVYDRDERLSGEGKYNRFLGSLTIGLNGIFCFSHYPLHVISWVGIAISAASFLLALLYLILKLVAYPIKWGNPTLVILISFIGGMQLLSLGIIGQYLARIFDSAVARPLYIVDRLYGLERKK
ncbi:MAG: glycosyltransferase family 2 protein [Oligoflexia bacterium]|nr:glycosyltransferase family 2 protein [Oligoflexia bacterium]MBF0366304.1 glycosyltransferase family 2 protein [Oligoflexia bacterium]